MTKPKKILDKCSCPCHTSCKDDSKSPTSSQSSNRSDRFHSFDRPTMASLHDMIQGRQWFEVKRAIRQDVSVAMRVDDSAQEDRWFARAREAAWRKDVGLMSTSNSDENYLDDRFISLDQDSEDADKEVEKALSMRYWVSNSTDVGQAFVRQRRTLLHSVCKLKFLSDEALITQLVNGDSSDELRDLVGAVKVVQMIIDASHNELKPYPDDGEEDYYLELADDEVRNKFNSHFIGSDDCQTCSCYFHSQYCPPVGLDPVERYSESIKESDEHSEKKVLHYSVLTMTDALGATPLHLLTGEGSGHTDLVRAFIDGCCTLDDGADAELKEPTRRPTLYDLCAAQNGHGCTPFHFLSDGSNEEVLRLLLDHLQKENDKLKLFDWHQWGTSSTKAETKLHPLLIQDDDGDIPLHFACGNGASISLLSTLTIHPGNPYAVLVRNTEGKLAVDELIIWYTSGNEDESDSEGEYGDDSDGSDSSQSTTEREEEEITKELTPGDIVTRTLHSFMSVTEAQSLSAHCKYIFVERIRVLILAGGKCIALSDMTERNLLHASVILTKYFDFPAVALVSTVLLTMDKLNESDTENDFDKQHYATMALLQEDSFGLLPLHWACGGIKCISSLKAIVFDTNTTPATTSNVPATSRWGVQVGCSMISYLLYLCPESARIPNRSGRLPLHVFLDEAHENQDDLMKLLKACPEALSTPDVQSRMYPFQTAASVGNGSNQDTLKSLDVTYCLMMEDPSLCRVMDKNK